MPTQNTQSNIKSPYASLDFLIVDKSMLLATVDYNLSASRYKVQTDYTNAKWPMVKLGDLIETITPAIKIKKEEYKDKGSIPIYDQSQNEIGGYTDNRESEIIIDKPVVIFGDHTCVVKFTETNFAQGADGIKILLTKNELLSKFLYYFLKVNPVESEGYKRHFSKLKLIQIPLPPLSVQEEIVKEIDQYQKIIDGARQVIENWKPKIDIDPEWEKVKLGEVCEYFIGLTYSPEDVSKEGIIVLRSSNVQNGVLDFSDIVRVNKKIKENLIVKDGDILMCSRNGSKRLVGKIATIKNLSEEMTFGTFMTIIRGENNKFLSYFFESDLFREQIEESETSSINQITKNMLNNVIVPFPNQEIQDLIVKKNEEERNLVETNKKLVEIFEEKVREVINKVWK